ELRRLLDHLFEGDLFRLAELLLVSGGAPAHDVADAREEVAEDVGAEDRVAAHQPQIPRDLPALDRGRRHHQHDRSLPGGNPVAVPPFHLPSPCGKLQAARTQHNRPRLPGRGGLVIGGWLGAGERVAGSGGSEERAAHAAARGPRWRGKAASRQPGWGAVPAKRSVPAATRASRFSRSWTSAPASWRCQTISTAHSSICARNCRSSSFRPRSGDVPPRGAADASPSPSTPKSANRSAARRSAASESLRSSAGNGLRSVITGLRSRADAARPRGRWWASRRPPLP